MKAHSLGLSRWLVLTALIAAALLAGLETAWFFVANRAVMSESTRHFAKSALLVTSVVGLTGLSVGTALRGGAGWWRATAFTMAVVVALSAALSWLLLRLVGVHQSENSALLGEPFFVRVGAGVAGLVLFVAVLVGGSVLLGWLARLVVPRQQG